VSRASFAVPRNPKSPKHTHTLTHTTSPTLTSGHFNYLPSHIPTIYTSTNTFFSPPSTLLFPATLISPIWPHPLHSPPPKRIHCHLAPNARLPFKTSFRVLTPTTSLPHTRQHHSTPPTIAHLQLFNLLSHSQPRNKTTLDPPTHHPQKQTYHEFTPTNPTNHHFFFFPISWVFVLLLL